MWHMLDIFFSVDSIPVKPIEKKPKITTTKVNEPSKPLVSKAKVIKMETKDKTQEAGQGDHDPGGLPSALSDECVKTLEKKIRWILTQLDDCTQIQQISDLLDLLQKCHSTLESIRK